MTAIEYGGHPLLWRPPMYPPKEVVGKLLLCRLFKAHQIQTCDGTMVEDIAYCPIFTTPIHALQDLSLIHIWH